MKHMNSLIDSQTLGKTSQIWGVILTFSAFVLSPFYFFGSGSLQPVFMLMFLVSLLLIAFNMERFIAVVKRNKAGILFLLLALIVNVIYGLYYQDIGFFISWLHWLYGFILLASVIIISRDKFVTSWVPRFILFKLVLVAVLYILGWGDYTFWPRYQYFFNGPNQLAYFVICLLLVFLVANRAELSVSFYAAYALTIFIVISTGGRSAYLAMLPLGILLFWLGRKKFLHWLLLLVLPFAVGFAFQYLSLPLYAPGQQSNDVVEGGGGKIAYSNTRRSVFGQTVNRIDTLSIEEEPLNETSVMGQLISRGYMRAIEYPQYLLYGAGQGQNERFGFMGGHINEIHSSLLAVWFYYGILGLVFFVLFIWRIFDVKINILFLSPLFVYGLFTYGLRAPFFWLALAYLATAPQLLVFGKSDDQ